MVAELDLDALVGRVGTRRRRRQAVRMGVAAAAVLAVVGALLAVTRGLGDDEAIPPSGDDDVRTVSPDAAWFLEAYLTGPYIPNGFLVVAPAASVGLEPELIATATIEDVQPRGVPTGDVDRDRGRPRGGQDLAPAHRRGRAAVDLGRVPDRGRSLDRRRTVAGDVEDP